MLKILKRLWKKTSEPLQARARVTIPEGRVSDIFAIGDIHGCLDLLVAAEQRIFERMKHSNKPVIVLCVGDFVDRGPDSKGVIDHLIRKMPAPFYRICICGNHDDAFLEFLESEQLDLGWLEFGGDKTLKSYGINVARLRSEDPSGLLLREAARDNVPADHVDFLQRLPVALSIGRYLFVHAGIVPGLPLAAQSDADLMWIREPFLSRGSGLDITVVHGHTPVGTIQHGPNRIGIDTGAYATGKLGVLHIGSHGVSEI